MDPQVMETNKKTLKEMWADRGYSVSPSTITFSKFKKQDYFILSNHESTEESTEKIIIFCLWITVYKPKPSYVKKQIEMIQKKFADTNLHIVIIIKDVISSLIKNVIKRYKQVELYHYKELSFNLTHHQLVPKHSKLSPTEKRELHEKYGIERELQLPILSVNDPISKYYAFQKGDICKITRTHSTNGVVVAYRYVA